MDTVTMEIALVAMNTKAHEPSYVGYSRAPGVNCIQFIYNQTPVGSPARRLLAQLYAEPQLNFPEPPHHAVPDDFIRDLKYVKGVVERTSRRD
jgi:hypothetical protein